MAGLTTQFVQRSAGDCGRCHFDGGSLAGQWMGYLELNFAKYESGEREQSMKLKEKTDKRSTDDVKTLLHYYASQQ